MRDARALGIIMSTRGVVCVENFLPAANSVLDGLKGPGPWLVARLTESVRNRFVENGGVVANRKKAVSEGAGMASAALALRKAVGSSARFELTEKQVTVGTGPGSRGMGVQLKAHAGGGGVEPAGDAEPAAGVAQRAQRPVREEQLREEQLREEQREEQPREARVEQRQREERQRVLDLAEQLDQAKSAALRAQQEVEQLCEQFKVELERRVASPKARAARAESELRELQQELASLAVSSARRAGA